jgi:hypothetical protein
MAARHALQATVNRVQGLGILPVFSNRRELSATAAETDADP